MGKYFGTDGFRGEAGITLTADHAYKGVAFWVGITMLCVSAMVIPTLLALSLARTLAAAPICLNIVWLQV